MNSSKLFTGERFIPGIDDSKLEVEHYQRYASICQLVAGKVVLDAACGEGYGSNILAATAKKVTGIDIDADTIERARKTYSVRGNLYFEQGCIEKLDIADETIDVVVSFETIEHVPEQTQEKFLSEITRILKKDGILIMSTPNKKIYSDLHNYKNEFHIKEFYRDEFIRFLKTKFQYVKLYNQAFQVASIISSYERNENNIAYFNEEKDYQEGKYFIAIASNKAPEKEAISSLYIYDNNEYEENIQRILTLQAGEEERNQHIHKLDEEAEKAGILIKKLQEEEEERNRHIESLDLEIEQQRDKIGRQNEEIEQKNRQINQQSEQINLQKDEIGKQREQIKKIPEYEEQAIRLENELKKSIEKISECEKQLAKLIDELSEKNDMGLKAAHDIEELQQQIRNKEGHIELLLEVERAYEREKRTHAYKLSKRIQKLGNCILPINSRRRFFLRILYNVFRHPKLMFHVINPKRIKNYMKYMKKEGMEGVKKRYEEAVEIEKMHANPTEGLDLEIASVENKLVGEIQNIEDFEKIILPVWKEPEVTVIIPVYNEFNYTYNCLKSIYKNTKNVAYEIIVANDCSTDITCEVEKIVENVRLVTTKKNLRFLLNCNNAAKYAKGKYILFLNNDTQVQDNWLEPLVSLIESNKSIGMVGSKLVYPDGYLQEAGGIVWKDASAWNYGNRKNPEDPEFNYVKEVDYISGASIMIRRELWEKIGGFDEKFVPAYYEDTDLAFEVRKHGYKVMYQPLSVVVHFEGVSNGTDVSNGVKHYQQLNYEKFYNKWKTILEAEHEVNAENVFTAKDRSNHKKHILVVDHYVPHHDQDAGGKCTYMYLKLFVKMGFKVTFIGDNFFKHEPYTTELNQMGIEVLYGNYYYNNWKEWLKENCHYFDYIYLQRPHISVKYIDLVKQYSHAKVFYFAHDLHHIREYREYEMTKDPEKLASSKHWKEIEYDLFQKADVGHVVGSYEQGIMQKVFPNKPVRNIPLYIYTELLDDINKDFSRRQDLLYVGGFGHPPNVDAVLWFAQKVFPRILEKYPEMKWHVVGGKVPKEVSALASDNIIIEGFLSDQDLEKLYRTCRMAVVPLRFGAGVKGKVVEAAYYQIPLVTTSIGAEGLSREEHSMLVEDGGIKMAELICETYTDYDKLRKMSDNGRMFIEKHFMLTEAERILRLDIDI